MALLRSLRDAVPGLTRLSRTHGVQRVLRPVMRSAVIEGGARLQALETLGRVGRVEHYKLRGHPVRFALRHGTRDVDIADEVFVGVPCYQPPREVARLLAGHRGLRILDLGGNIGLFGAYVLSRHPTAHITSYEPDPANARVLERTIALNPQARWTLEERCVGIAPGDVRLAAGRYADSHVTDDGGITVKSVDVFGLLDAADWVKMDIEGSEWPILSDRRLEDARCTALVLEWHERNAPAGGAFNEAAARLRAAGFETTGDRGSDSHGVLWAWRTNVRA